MNIQNLTSGSRSRLLVMAVLGVVIVILGIRIAGQVFKSDESAKSRIYRETRDIVGDLAMRPMQSRDDIVTSLRMIKFTGEELMSSSQHDALVGFVADLIATYHLSETSDDYRRWREQRGNTLRQGDQVDRREWSADYYQQVFSIYAPDPELAQAAIDTQDWGTLFETSWNIRRTVGDGANVAVKIGSDLKGLMGETALLPGPQAAWPQVPDQYLSEGWGGGSTSGGRLWFRQPHTFSQLMASEESVLVSVVWVFFEFRDGIRRPMYFWCFWDQADSQWRLENVIQTNVPEDHITWPWDM